MIDNQKEFFYKSLKKMTQLKGEITINVSGDSMLPTFKNNDKILVKYKDIDNIVENDIIVHFYWKKSMTVHRVVEKVYEKGNTFLKTKGDNNSYIDDYLVDESCLIGVAFRKADCDV